jgi:hypothetical protein
MNATGRLEVELNSVASAKGAIDRASVEHKAQELVTEIFASDVTWDAMGCAAGWYLLFLPLRERVQALARKYRQCPPAFVRAFKRLGERHIHEVAKDPEWGPHLARLAWYQQRVNEAVAHSQQEQSEQPLVLPQNLPQRKLVALDQIITALSPALSGRRIPDEDARKLLSGMQTLAARAPGRRALERYRSALEIPQSGKHRKDPFHQICNELDPLYRTDLASERRRKREEMRSGVNRLLKKRLEDQGLTDIPTGWRARLEALEQARGVTKSKH